jgi:uncharacterized membrane protein YfcA
MQRTLACPYFRRAFGWSVPIGGLAGLIGLGGGEFRLPVLMHVVGFDPRSAVPINLMISLVTLLFALLARGTTVSILSVEPYWPEIAGLIGGGLLSAGYGARLVHTLTSRRLVQTIALLLALIGLLLFVEAMNPLASMGLLPAGHLMRFAVGCILGLLIGIVSSMLGVAGGELIIPSLIIVFGVDVRTAGTASILISLCVITVGLWRYWQMGAIPQGRGVQRITIAMSLGSIIGAVIGGSAIGLAPATFLKVFLACVLIAAAGKIILSHRQTS